MLTGQALEIVLIMAKTTTTSRTDKGQEAIKEVEFLLTSYEDTGNYTEDDYMEEPATGCDYGIGG